MKRALAILIFLLVPTACLAQEEKKIPIAVGHAGKDQVGQSVIFALKEAIRASQSFRFVDYEASARTPRMVVNLASIEAAVSGTFGTAMAAAIVYESLAMPGNGIFLLLFQQTCDRSMVEECAKNILPHIDRAVEKLRKSDPSLWKTL